MRKVCVIRFLRLSVTPSPSFCRDTGRVREKTHALAVVRTRRGKERDGKDSQTTSCPTLVSEAGTRPQTPEGLRCVREPEGEHAQTEEVNALRQEVGICVCVCLKVNVFRQREKSPGLNRINHMSSGPEQRPFSCECERHTGAHRGFSPELHSTMNPTRSQRRFCTEESAPCMHRGVSAVYAPWSQRLVHTEKSALCMHREVSAMYTQRSQRHVCTEKSALCMHREVSAVYAPRSQRCVCTEESAPCMHREVSAVCTH
ncbi:hypothetical protein WMY93_009172 [Mugilogobius chulae]|uniref:Uncharacterized protein n=1 Tax=Mugilogobius chulae TaxID=88201 RepID=A0AAW0PEM5_9GOBI